MNYQCKAFRNGTEVDGRYANSLNVGHNSFEFVLNAGHFYPQNEHTQLHTRFLFLMYHIRGSRTAGLFHKAKMLRKMLI